LGRFRFGQSGLELRADVAQVRGRTGEPLRGPVAPALGPGLQIAAQFLAPLGVIKRLLELFPVRPFRHNRIVTVWRR
jgi:hypothetical protein